jgi:hypothetical protein
MNVNTLDLALLGQSLGNGVKIIWEEMVGGGNITAAESFGFGVPKMLYFFR